MNSLCQRGQWLPAVISTRPFTQPGVGILLKQVQHSLTWALSATYPWILASHSRRSLPKRSRLGEPLSKQEEGAVGSGSCKVLPLQGGHLREGGTLEELIEPTCLVALLTSQQGACRESCKPWVLLDRLPKNGLHWSTWD